MTLAQKLSLLAGITPLIPLASTSKGPLHDAIKDLLNSIAAEVSEPFKSRIQALADVLFSD